MVHGPGNVALAQWVSKSWTLRSKRSGREYDWGNDGMQSSRGV